MAQADSHPTSKFDNMPAAMLADALGEADATLKAYEAQCQQLKAEIKRRGLSEVIGDNFAVSVTTQISRRLDQKAVKNFLGDSYQQFEVPIISTVVRIRPARQLSAAA